MGTTQQPSLREKASAIIDSHPHCALALIEPDDSISTSIITVSKHDGLRWVTFCSGLHGRRSARINHSNRAAACFTDGESSINLTGTIEILSDPESKRTNWYPALSNHFSGPDDPNYCVLKLTTTRIGLFVDWQDEYGAI